MELLHTINFVAVSFERIVQMIPFTVIEISYCMIIYITAEIAIVTCNSVENSNITSELDFTVL